MKRKPNIIIIGVIVFLLLFSACTGPEDIENLLIGTWKYMNYQTGDWEKLTFKEDLTFVLKTYDGSEYTTSTYTSTYSYDEDTFTLEQYYYVNVRFSYSISGDSLAVSNGRIYIKQ